VLQEEDQAIEKLHVNEPLRAQGAPIGVKRRSIGLLYREGLLRKGLFE